jgi:Ca2+-binding RTX toxin-like protein
MDRTIDILSPTGKSLRKLGFTADRVSWQPESICGFAGADRIAGGGGRDRLFGGDGNDTIAARDGAFDVVGCGPGTDTAHVDPLDYVGVDCERVSRR